MSKRYTTVQGDMWDTIAYTQMGDITYTDKLINLNQEYRGYYIFPAGIQLTLPELELDAPAVLPPWKQVSRQ